MSSLVVHYQALATVLSGAMTLGAIIATSRFQITTSKTIQNSNQQFEKEWRERDEKMKINTQQFEKEWRERDEKMKINTQQFEKEWRLSQQNFEEKWRRRDEADKLLTKYLHSIEQLNDIRKDLRYQIYSTPHREVSIATRVLKTLEKPEGNYISKLDFYDEFKNSIDENILKMNDYRSLCRDNFANIKSLMEEYVEKRPVGKKLAEDLEFEFNHKLLTNGDSERLKKRFQRFVDAVKPMDSKYPKNNDDDLYDIETFENLLNECSGEPFLKRK